MRVTAQTKAATRKALLQAARRLFSQNGYEATTTRDIARAAQIASGTLFNYFPTKEAIVACLANEALGDALAETRDSAHPAHEADTLEEDLFALIAGGLRKLKQLRKHLPSLLETTLSPLALAPQKDSASFRAGHLEAVAALAARHGYRHLSPVALQLYWTLYTGVLVFWANDPSPKQEDTLALVDDSLHMFVGWLGEPTPTDSAVRALRGGRTIRSPAMPSVAQLIKALPDHEAIPIARDNTSPGPAGGTSLRPVPLGRLRRLGLLGTLQAKIAAAYFFYWVRGWFKNAPEKERLLAETHWRTAAQVLHSMGYLRGAVMKVGQMLANFPDIAPAQFVQTLEQLQFHAPPMHWSLLREMVHNELEGDPEDLFASFDKRAFAAASLGQVHRAELRNGESVAVKIQYPGIGRAIGEDLTNLLLFLLPARLSADWQNTREQFDDLRARLEREADYQREAASLQRARSLFRPADGIVIPRVFPEQSTARVLTMEYLEGVHLDEFLAGNPSQELRNEFARKMLHAWYRMLFAGRTLYADFHPGNFLFMPDGRLGVIDFGMMVELDDRLWDLFRKMDRPLTTGRREDRLAVLKEWSWIDTDDPAQEERARLTDEYTDWSWRPRYCGGEFDFGDEAEFRRGIDLFRELASKRYSRARPCTPVIARQHFGWWSMLYRLKAKIEIAPIAEEEVHATGWDRRDYAPVQK